MSGRLGWSVFLVVVAAMLAIPPEPARAASLDCLTASATLEELITCAKSGMPRKNSQGYVVPTPDEQADWSGVTWAMLNGSCENIILPASLARSYSIAKFLDRQVGREYCVLLETRDEDDNGRVDKGWGTLITDARPLREIIVLAPHPLSDSRTHLQSVEVFKGVRARAVLVSGTHRAASERGGAGACGESRSSDPTHSVDTMFQPTLSEAMELYGQLQREYVVLQFHGMAETTCAGVDVHLSNGSSDSVDDKVHELRQALQALEPEWTVTTPESATACPMDGARNVQVRLLAGVPYEELCDPTPVPGSPRFVHIEQKREVRRDTEVWVRAVRDTWPRTVATAAPALTVAAPPGAPVIAPDAPPMVDDAPTAMEEPATDSGAPGADAAVDASAAAAPGVGGAAPAATTGSENGAGGESAATAVSNGADAESGAPEIGGGADAGSAAPEIGGGADAATAVQANGGAESAVPVDGDDAESAVQASGGPDVETAAPALGAEDAAPATAPIMDLPPATAATVAPLVVPPRPPSGLFSVLPPVATPAPARP